MHIEFLVEEQSSAEFLNVLVAKLLRGADTFRIHPFAGKPDLLKSLPHRLAGYKAWLPEDWRIITLVDCDKENCGVLKAKIEDCAHSAGLQTKSAAMDKKHYQMLNRIAVEELEAWFFGDVEALTSAYPRIPSTLAEKRKYRNSDAITGGTWEALEKVLQTAGHYPAGMPKIEVARNVSQHMNPDRNRSPSFRVFINAIREMLL